MSHNNGHRPLQLLLLEDRSTDADLLMHELRRAGVHVDVKVVSTRAAYVEGLESRLDAVLSDFNLPQFDAKEALGLLQARKLDIPFIVVSGAIGEETAVEIMKLGATDYFLKDRLARLPQALTRAVDAAHLRRKNQATEEALRAAAIQTVEVLRRRNEQYRVLFATYPSPTWVYDDETLAFLAVNDVAVRDYGYSREEFLAMTIRDIRPVEDVPALLASPSTTDPGRQEAGVWRHLRKNGDLFLAEIYVSPIEFEGRPAHLVVANDVTQKHEAEEAIRRSEGRLRAIIDHEPECVKTVSAEGILLEMNAAGLRMIDGEDLSQISGKPVANLVHPDDRVRFAELHARAAAGGTGRLLFRIVSLNGTERWMETHSVGLDEGQPGPRSVLSVTRDVTDRLAAEEGMRVQASMLDQIDQAVIATDMSDRVIYANRAAGELYGWKSLVEMRGTDIMELTVPPDSRLQADQIMTALALGGKWRGEFVCRRRDGSEFEAFCTTTPLLNKEGTRIGSIGTSTDITEQKRSEKALRESERDQRKLAAQLETERARLAAAQKVAKVGSWETDLSSLVTLWSEETHRIFETAPATFHPTHSRFLELVHPDDRLSVNEALNRSVTEKGVHALEHRLQFAGGRVKFVEERWEMDFDAKGNAVRAFGTCQDITERKNADQALRESEERFSSAFEDAPIGVALVSPEGKWLRVNRALCHILDCAEADLLAHDIVELTHSDDIDATREVMRRLLAGELESVSLLEKRYVRKSGSVVTALTSISLVRDAQGAPNYFISQVQDISERKQTELVMERTLQRLMDAQKIGEIGDWEWDLATEKITWSPEVFEIFRRDPSLGAPRNYEENAEQFDDASQSLLEAKVRLVIESGEPQEYELRAYGPGGVPIDVFGRAMARKGSDGKVLGLFGTVQNITQRKRAEAGLKEAEEKYRSIFDNASEGIFQNTPEGAMISANPALARMLGFDSPEELIQSRYNLKEQSYVVPAQRDELQRLLETNDSVNDFEYEVKRKDGSALFVSENVRVIRDAGGRALYYEGSVQNISKRRMAEEVLAESERRLRFLNDLGNLTRVLTDPKKIIAATTRLLGVHMRVSRCVYAEMENDGDHFTIVNDYAHLVPSIVGSYQLADFGETTSTELTAGRTLVLRDVKKEISPKEGAASFEALQIEAMIACPVIKKGRLVAAMAVHHLVPREWTDAEVTLIEEVVDRCWSILERARAQLVLRESEEHLRLVIAASNDGIWEHNLLTNSLTWSDRMYEIIGVQRDSFVPGIDSITERIHPNDRTSFQETVAEQLAHGERYEARLRVLREDGTYGNFLARGSGVLNAAGQPIGAVGSLTDLTSLLQAELKLVEQAELLNLAPDAIMVRSLDDRILFWNRGAETIYGWTSADAMGHCAKDILYTDPEKYALARIILLETDAWSGELREVAKDGSALTVDSRWTLVRDENGTPKSILVINTDITEKQKLAAQFLRAQRVESIGTLASGVAHDLNNILAPILMGAAVLRRSDMPAGDEAILSTIETCAQRGADIVKQVLTFARGAEGERLLLQPAHLISDMAKIAGETFPKLISIRTAYSEQLWPIEGDPTQLHQVLLNLTVNARDAMPAGGTLTISAENFPVDEHYASMTSGAKVGPHVLIQVRDTGMGIPHQIIDKIFDPFFTTKELGQGTGLGLSTVIGIVKSHGGFVGVYSEIGRGTSFKIFLPATISGEGVPQITEKTTLSPANGELLLLVDDEKSILIVAEALLKAHGYQILTAADAPEALAIFAQRMSEITVVLTDLSMPLMDGLSLIRTLQKMKPDVCIIACTGRGGPGNEAHELARLRVAACLSKPYNKEKLLTTLNEVIHPEIKKT